MEGDPPKAEKVQWTPSIGFWLGLVLFLLVFVIPASDEGGALPPQARKVAAVTLLCAVWWITQPIPIPATSLIPLVLLPALGVMEATSTARAYTHDLIILLMGGFFLSQAIQKCGLHRRIALRIITALGRRPETIILGFMIATGVISMWVSNTATCLMILPIALAVLSQVEEVNPEEETGVAAFGVALLLGIAYGANIGGIGTPIGTPPNVIFMQQLRENFPGAEGVVTFPKWMAYTIPLVIILIPLTWVVLTRVLCRVPSSFSLGERDVLDEEIRKLGPMPRAQRRVLILFAITAFLWIFRSDIVIEPPTESASGGRAAVVRDGAEEESGGLRIPGVVTILAWSKILPEEVADPAKNFVGDGTIAILMVLIFFLVPSGEKKGENLLDWPTASRIPWGLLLLFGGGLAIARGFQETGLAIWLGGRLEFLRSVPPIVMIGSVCLMLTFLTEVTSNTAITSVMMPILASLSRGIDVNPMLLMMPAAISASFAFMLPVATGPNAVVFSSGRVPIAKMVKAGILLNLICAVVLTLYIYLVLVHGAGIEIETPGWAK